MATKGSGNWKNNLDGEKKKDLKMWQNENETADLKIVAARGSTASREYTQSLPAIKSKVPSDDWGVAQSRLAVLTSTSRDTSTSRFTSPWATNPLATSPWALRATLSWRFWRRGNKPDAPRAESIVPLVTTNCSCSPWKSVSSTCGVCLCVCLCMCLCVCLYVYVQYLWCVSVRVRSCTCVYRYYY